MRSIIRAALKNKKLAILWGAGAVAALMLAFIASAQATDKASFCTTCHEMTPYYAAWGKGPHSSVSCIECHVDAGTTERLAHKFVALGEVYSHFFNEPLFPMNATDVPNERCLACHQDTIDPGIAGFDHEAHRGDKPCIQCHSEVGHKVSAEALADAGVLNAEAQAAKEARVIAQVGRGADNLPDHEPVSCSTCHDMAKTGCESCHTPKHETRDVSTTCTDCHSAGATWVFEHPARTDCATCHEAPEKHFPQACETCHTTVQTFEFTHPAAGSDCAQCHARPAEHRDGACANCHSPGEKWTFAHPAGSANCATCHQKPAKHYSGTCSSCHTPGRSFASTVFRHPGASATCTNCHKAPSGHRSGACTTCHKPASSWRFYHPASTKCASCHSAPANHYGTTCASCHSPGSPWGSASFSHPKIPGGKHTYKSFSCVSCHPSGYSSYSCLKCHDSNNPDD